MEATQIGLWVLLGVALIISVATDLWSRRIPDLVTFPAIAGALMLRWLFWGVGGLESGLLSGVVAAASAAALFAVLAYRRRMGWGDVKLVAAVGAALGYPLVLAALVFISLVGAAQALATLLWHLEVWLRLSAAVRRILGHAPPGSPPPSGRPRHVPYAIAIALGSFWAMWWGQHSGSG